MDIERLAGTRLGNYEIESLLGRGGMGVVYKARQVSLDRPVALKILLPNLSSNVSFVKRFQREAEAVAKLNHPNIVQVIDISKAEGVHFFSMQYVRGKTLDEVLNEQSCLDVAEAVRIISQAAQGIEHAHKNGIIHRDIKPSNIILDESGTAKIMDFGLARRTEERSRITRFGAVMGTVDYMSPEQARGEQTIDHRSDIWSLGVVLFEMLTGSTPFVALSDSAVIHKIIYEEPLEVRSLNPEVPPGLSIVIARAITKDQEKRYGNISEFLRDLLTFETLSAEKGVSSSAHRKTKLINMREVLRKKDSSFIAQRMPFVGRKGEWSDILEALTQASFGNGALIMIGGEPGVGKTRLTEEVLNEALPKGFLCLVGHCYDMQGGQPYMPFVEIIESAARIVEPAAFLLTLGESAPEVAKLVPELRRKFNNIPLAAELPPEQEQRYTFNSIAKFIERVAEEQPLLLVLEDLHWAGESTMLLLQHIARQLDSMPVLIIGSYRDTELAVSRPLARVMEDLLRQRLAGDIVLSRLLEADVAKMLQELSDQEPPASLVKLIFGQTEGNPFFVEEILKHLAHQEKLFDQKGNWRTNLSFEEADVPRGVRLILGHRIQRVGEQCLETLTAAATAGRVVESKLLEQLLDLDEVTFLDSVEEAERARLLRSTTRAGTVSFAFPHELIRQTLLSDISGLRRQRLHFRVAEAIEKVYPEHLNERAAELAYHLKKGGASADVQKTAHYIQLAGDNAYSMGAAIEAMEFYKEALSLDVSKRDRAEIRYKLGLAFCVIGKFDEALDEWRKALTLYEEIGETEKVGDLCSEISRRLLWGLRLQEAYEIANRGLAALGESVNASRCLLLAASGHVLGFLPAIGYELPNNMCEQALEMAETLGKKELEGPILYRKAMFHRSYWQNPEVVDCALRSLDLLRKGNNPFDTANALMAAQWGLMHVGRLQEAAAVERELETFSPKRGAELNRCIPDIYECLLRVMVDGDLERFERRISEALEDSIQLEWGWLFMDYGCLGTAQFWRGNWERAEESYRKGFESIDPKATGAIGFVTAPLLIIFAYTGKRDEVLKIMRENRGQLPSAGRPNPIPAWTMLAAAIEALAVLEQYDEVAGLYPLAQEAVATGNLIQPFCSGLVQTTAGIAAAAGQLWEQAEEHFDTALKQAHEIPHVIEQPEVRRWYAHMLMKRGADGDLDKAHMLLKEAIELYQKIDMPRHLGMAQSLIEQIDSMIDPATDCDIPNTA
jgi:serine/threonine protein kinase/tetratricopeptide (TPR) repeat protein